MKLHTKCVSPSLKSILKIKKSLSCQFLSVRKFLMRKDLFKKTEDGSGWCVHLALVAGSALQILAENSQGSSLRQQSAMVSSMAWKADS